MLCNLQIDVSVIWPVFIDVKKVDNIIETQQFIRCTQ